MLDILVRAGCFVAIIILGYVLKKLHVFREGDFRVLATVTLKITLPASIVVSFAQMQIDPGMLTIALLGLGGGVVYILAAFLLNLRSNAERRAFEIVNLPGYNIGLFAMPFVQSFLGPIGVVTTSLFDTGNAFVCLGGSYGIAASVKDGSGFSFKRIGKALITSVPFLSYIVMILLNLTGIRLPSPVLSFAEVIKNANTFMAMLMIGVGFQLTANKTQLGTILKLLLTRYLIAAALAAAFYFLLPFSLEIRKTLVLLAFSPIGSAVPAFVSEMKGDVGLSSAVNSICILCSIVIMTVLLTVM